MGKDISGSIRKLTLDGITFDVMSDANLSKTGSQFENDRIATSGKSFKKMTKRVTKVESVVIKLNVDEDEILEGLAERLEDFPMSYTTASGSVYRAVGSIEYESFETMENRGTVQLHPSTTWDRFAG